jgi:phage protein D
MTKKQELADGANGCFAKASEDEMLFILRAQDITAPVVIMEWIKGGLETNTSDEKLREAFECALTMRKFFYRKNPD